MADNPRDDEPRAHPADVPSGVRQAEARRAIAESGIHLRSVRNPLRRANTPVVANEPPPRSDT